MVGDESLGDSTASGGGRGSRRERKQTDRFNSLSSAVHPSITGSTKDDKDTKCSDTLPGDEYLDDAATSGGGRRCRRERKQTLNSVQASSTESMRNIDEKTNCCPTTDGGGGRRSRRARKQTDRFTFPVSGHHPSKESTSTKDDIDDKSECSGFSAGDEYLEDSATDEMLHRPEDGELAKPATKVLDGTNHVETAVASTKERKHIEKPKDRPPAPKRTLRAFTLHVPVLKREYVSEDVPEWSEHQLDQLRAAHASVQPTSRSFWWEVSAHVNEKSAKECREMWFSFSKTPKEKKSKPNNGMSSTVHDDLFQSTPMRALCPSKKINPAMLKVGKPPAKTLNSSSSQVDSVQSPVPPVLARGYKGYLNNMRKDMARAQKAKGKTVVTKKESAKVLSEYDASADIRVRLTPSGTLRVRHNLHESGSSAEEFDEDNKSTMTE